MDIDEIIEEMQAGLARERAKDRLADPFLAGYGMALLDLQQLAKMPTKKSYGLPLEAFPTFVPKHAPGCKDNNCDRSCMTKPAEDRSKPPPGYWVGFSEALGEWWWSGRPTVGPWTLWADTESVAIADAWADHDAKKQPRPISTGVPGPGVTK